MSETEHLVGKLKPIQIIDTIETTAKELCIAHGYGSDLEDYYKSWVEKLADNGYRKYLVEADKIYQIETKQLDPYQDIFKAAKNADGSVEFEVRYYDGGCSLNEALERALKSLKGN